MRKKIYTGDYFFDLCEDEFYLRESDERSIVLNISFNANRIYGRVYGRTIFDSYSSKRIWGESIEIIFFKLIVLSLKYGWDDDILDVEMPEGIGGG